MFRARLASSHASASASASSAKTADSAAVTADESRRSTPVPRAQFKHPVRNDDRPARGESGPRSRGDARERRARRRSRAARLRRRRGQRHALDSLLYRRLYRRIDRIDRIDRVDRPRGGRSCVGAPLARASGGAVQSTSRRSTTSVTNSRPTRAPRARRWRAPQDSTWTSSGFPPLCARRETRRGRSASAEMIPTTHAGDEDVLVPRDAPREKHNGNVRRGRRRETTRREIVHLHESTRPRARRRATLRGGGFGRDRDRGATERSEKSSERVRRGASNDAVDESVAGVGG